MIECWICKKTFSTKKLLSRHINRIHNPSYTPSPPRLCEYCGKWYQNLHQHFKRTHSSNPVHIEEVKRNKAKAKIYYSINKDKIKKTALDWYYSINKIGSKESIQIQHKEVILSFE